jgi:hypothetical protein
MFNKSQTLDYKPLSDIMVQNSPYLSNSSATISAIVAFIDWKITPLNNLSVIIITNVYSSTNGKSVMKSIEISD